MKNKEKVKEEIWCQSLINGHTLQYRAHGGSMKPFIRSNSNLTIKPAEKISIGDIIVFQSKKGLVTHRVVKKKRHEDHLLITKGDNSETTDGLVKRSQVVGKVVKIEYEGNIIELASPLWRSLNYVIALLSPFYGHLMFVLRKLKRLGCK